MPLTDAAVRNAKATDKTLRLKDDRGLYLEVSPKGGKWWRMRYWLASKENRLSLGVYPDVSLKEARERRDEARRLIANGIDPSQARKDEKTEAAAETLTFEHVARERYERFKPKWSASHSLDIIQRLEKNIFPQLGSHPIREITVPELLAAIRLIEGRGAVESARRVLQMCGQIFRYAIATGQADRDIAADLRGALPPAREKHHASITDPKGVAQLLRAIDGYQGSFVALCALRIAPLVFVRPGELRHAEWSEIDLDKAEWGIPAEKNENAGTAHSPAFPASRRHPARTASPDRSRALRVPINPDLGPPHVREHHFGRAAPHGLHQGRNDRSRLPLHGLYPA